MNPKDRCFCELAPLYALDLLDGDDRLWVEAQMIEYPELAAELAAHQLAINTLPYAAPLVPLAADLKDRLFQRLAEEPATVPPPVPLLLPTPSNAFNPHDRPATTPTLTSTAQSSEVTSIRRRNVVWLQAAGTIAAIAVIALLVDNYRLRQNLETEAAIVATFQQPNSVVYTLKGTEKAAQASGSLVVNARDKTAVVLVQNLPTLPDGQAYRVWAIAKGATKPTYCGQFTNNRTDPVRWSLPESICSANAPQMLITAELVTAPPVPQGELVMKSVL